MSWIRRNEVGVMITAVCGFIVLISYYVKVPILNNITTGLQNWAVVIVGGAMGFGAITLIIKEVKKIMKKEKDWQYSIILLASLFTMTITSLIPPFFSHPISNWMFQNLQVRISTTLFALLAPYVASASYRAFRARNLEAALMLIVAMLIMIGNTPLMAVVWEGFPAIGSWINTVPSMAGQRGITIGVTIGGIALSMRFLLGYERSHLGKGDS